MPRITVDQWALRLASLTALRSTCLRRSVGAVLLDAAVHVLSTGYNGVAAGLPHCNEPTAPGQPGDNGPVYGHACSGSLSPSGTNLDGCQAIHAEQNALLQCRDVMLVHTCYVTVSPCMTCAKLLLNTGCQRIVFNELYPGSDQVADLWLGARREWSQVALDGPTGLVRG